MIRKPRSKGYLLNILIRGIGRLTRFALIEVSKGFLIVMGGTIAVVTGLSVVAATDISISVEAPIEFTANLAIEGLDEISDLLKELVANDARR